jgi:hypothetical protein
MSAVKDLLEITRDPKASSCFEPAPVSRVKKKKISKRSHDLKSKIILDFEKSYYFKKRVS